MNIHWIIKFIFIIIAVFPTHSIDLDRNGSDDQSVPKNSQLEASSVSGFVDNSMTEADSNSQDISLNDNAIIQMKQDSSLKINAEQLTSIPTPAPVACTLPGTPYPTHCLANHHS